MAGAQGRADVGVYCPPMTRSHSLNWAEGGTAASPEGSAARQVSSAYPLESLSGLMKCSSPIDSEIPDPEQAYQVQAVGEGYAIRLQFIIQSGTYLYKDKLKFSVKSP